MRFRGAGAATLVAAAATFAVVGTAAAERGGEPGPPPHAEGQEPPPHAQDPGPPPHAQGPPEQKDTPPGQEQRGGRPAPPGQDVRDDPPPRRPAQGENRGRGNGNRGGQADRPPEDRGSGQPKTQICHRTGSDSNPYVLIEVANPSLENGHGRHHDHGDIIPAPAGGCPETAATASATSGSPADPGSPGTPADPGSASAQARSAPADPGPLTTALPASGVLGAFEENTPVSAAVTSPAVEGATTTGDEDDGLPFTGLQLFALLALGAASLGIGAALRSTGSPPARF